MEVLERFGEPTRRWFSGAFGFPTSAQAGAWQAISQGRNTLVVAPTGSGKTLAAFLWAIDRLFRDRGSRGGEGRAASKGGTASDGGTKSSGGAAGCGAARRGAGNRPRNEDCSTATPGGGRSRAAPDVDAAAQTRILYVSPLKALGVDVERNLRVPLAGIVRAARELGLTPPELRVGVRSGDTTPSQRQRLMRKPPDILITTPESLYLMLTSKARQTLSGVHTVIVDEVHAVAGSKRGAHLVVSLERLDGLLAAPAQRIGLSATVRPLEEVARFLGGAAPVDVVAGQASRNLDLSVSVPVADLRNLPTVFEDGSMGRGEVSARQAAANGNMAPYGGSTAGEGSAAYRNAVPRVGAMSDKRAAPEGNPAPDGDLALDPESVAIPAAGSVWPYVEESVVDQVLRHRSTIVFVNSRRLAERLTSRLNEAYVRRLGYDPAGLDGDPAGTGLPPFEGDTAAARPPAEVIGQSGQSEGALPVLAKSHHGSVAKQQRTVIEAELKSGQLRCVVATSSLELGIDMGAVDLVIQIESPPSVASGLQRVGRAGHHVGGVSRAIFYPKHSGDLLRTAVVAERMLDGRIEELSIPRNPLDILAQQTVAQCALGSVDVEQWFAMVRRSAPFQSLPRSVFDTVLDFLAGRYPSDEFEQLRPRLVWDREAGTIIGRPGTLRLAVTSGGTIPDRGMYGVFVAGQKRAARVGELDEEMVYESRVGDVFTLGTTSWRIVEITHDRVNVAPAFGRPGRLPFWRADGLGRSAELGEAMGCFYREISEAPEVDANARLAAAGLDANARSNLLAYLREQRAATGTLPTDRALTIERGRDDTGDWHVTCTHRLAVLCTPRGHSPFPRASGLPTAATPRQWPATTASSFGFRTRPRGRPARNSLPSIPTSWNGS